MDGEFSILFFMSMKYLWSFTIAFLCFFTLSAQSFQGRFKLVNNTFSALLDLQTTDNVNYNGTLSGSIGQMQVVGMITYMANERGVRTAYLSLTRGDGGQNLIGKEVREVMGIIRTQELLAARRTDGGEQFFSRANDFGFSKHPNETLKIWDKDKVLGDAVWTIRNFKPDVIITRFSPDRDGLTHE